MFPCVKLEGKLSTDRLNLEHCQNFSKFSSNIIIFVSRGISYNKELKLYGKLNVYVSFKSYINAIRTWGKFLMI